MKKLARIILPVIILGCSFWVVSWLKENKPQASRKPADQTPSLTVDAYPLQRQDYALSLLSYGTVEAATQSTLVAQVAGVVMGTSSNYVSGGFVQQNELLIELDKRDYETQVAVSEANLAQAQANLELEQAQSAQALLDWQRLGRSQNEPDALVLRKPQLAAARAAVASARAQLDKAKLDLQRTQIRVPFNGRILTKLADLGQYVAAGTAVAELYSTDFAEVRLPLSQRQFEFLDENAIAAMRGNLAPEHRIEVKIRDAQMQSRSPLIGVLDRVEGQIDAQTRQLTIVARIENAFSPIQDKPALVKGQFVQAEILGSTLRDVIPIPIDALQQGDEVILVVDGALQRQAIKTIWKDEQFAIAVDGVESDDLLVLSPVGSAISGTPVTTQLISAPEVKSQ